MRVHVLSNQESAVDQILSAALSYGHCGGCHDTLLFWPLLTPECKHNVTLVVLVHKNDTKHSICIKCNNALKATYATCRVYDSVILLSDFS